MSDPMTPSEALRRARSTLDCWDAGCDPPWDDCAMDKLEELWSAHHPEGASALLDGFSVDEITEAGG